MATLFDKHRLIVSPTLAPAQPRDAHQIERRPGSAGAALTIGLINNMPDSALQATERQFTRLLQAAAPDSHIHLHCFSLPSVKRSAQARQVIDGRYADIANLDRLKIDGLIVTGAEPNAASLTEEPFWQDLTAIVDWAEANTRSTIWSCLAAHAAVLHLDGIERQRLDVKCSGVYDCDKVADHWLLKGIASPLKISHSRLNALRKADLTACGYQLLTESAEAGIDIFAKRLRSHFIFFHGHPEYDALSLQREYLRDITRFLARQRASFPSFPAGYFTTDAESKLACYETRANAERTLPLSIELPKLTLRPDLAAGAAASAIFKNWLAYLSEAAKLTAGLPD
jgi:homoserine O-succinyltransferase/O-acetyltransferase